MEKPKKAPPVRLIHLLRENLIKEGASFWWKYDSEKQYIGTITLDGYIRCEKFQEAVKNNAVSPSTFCEFVAKKLGRNGEISISGHEDGILDGIPLVDITNEYRKRQGWPVSVNSRSKRRGNHSNISKNTSQETKKKRKFIQSTDLDSFMDVEEQNLQEENFIEDDRIGYKKQDTTDSSMLQIAENTARVSENVVQLTSTVNSFHEASMDRSISHQHSIQLIQIELKEFTKDTMSRSDIQQKNIQNLETTVSGLVEETRQIVKQVEANKKENNKLHEEMGKLREVNSFKSCLFT
jgi:hypothetical protein